MAETYDPLTLQVILQQLPEIERRKKAAERLRGAQARFQDLEQQKGSGNYVPTQQGGLFPTVARYQKDYAGATNKLVGAIGGYMSDREANKADTSLSELRNQEIIGAVQGMGQQPEDAGPDVATDRTLRAYLGMLGGPDIQGVLGKQVHRSGQVIDKSTGRLFNIMSDGTTMDTGITPDPKRQILSPEGQPIQVVDVTGKGAGTGQAVQFGIGDQSSIATPSFNPNPTPGATQATPAPEDEAERWYQAVEQQESGGDQSAVSPKGAQGVMQLMPATAREMENALGLPAGSTKTDPNANRAAGRAYLDQRMAARNGDRALALMDYNWGQGNVDKWIASGGDPAKVPSETRDYVQKVTQRATGGSPPSAASPASAPSVGTIRTPSAGEKAQAQKAGQIAAELATAPATAAAAAAQAGQVEAAKTGVQKQAEAKASLEKFRSTVGPGRAAIKALKDHKSLANITGGSIIGRVPDNPTARMVINAAMAGKGETEALAYHDQLKGQAFLQAFESLKGGGQITQPEGEKATEAMTRLNRAQSTESYKAALNDLAKLMDDIEARLVRQSEGGPAPAAAGPSIDDLMKKYGG